MRPRRHSILIPPHPTGDTHSTTMCPREIQIASLAAPRLTMYSCGHAVSFLLHPSHRAHVCCWPEASSKRPQTSDVSTDVMDSLSGEADSCSRGKQGLHSAPGFSLCVSACWFPSPACDAFNQFCPQPSRFFPPDFLFWDF